MGISLSFMIPGAEIKHLNIRKQGPEDDKILAVDIKFTGMVRDGDWLDELFLPYEDDADFSQDIRSVIWADDEESNLRMIGIRDFKSSRSFRGCTLEYGGMSLSGDCGKFSFKPLAGLCCELEFSFSVVEPGAKTVSILAEQVGESSKCELACRDLFDSEDATV